MRCSFFPVILPLFIWRFVKMIPSVGLEIGVLYFTPCVFNHYTHILCSERRERAPVMASTDELKFSGNLIQELNARFAVSRFVSSLALSSTLPGFQGFHYTDNMQCISALDRSSVPTPVLLKPKILAKRLHPGRSTSAKPKQTRGVLHEVP